MYDGGMGWGWAGALIAILFMLLVIAGIVALIVVATRWSGFQTRERGPEPPGGAERILAERFARGEIDEDEYVRRRRTLRGG